MGDQHIYRIATAAAWEAALREGVYRGAEVDARDGFLHFSTAAQAEETLRLHYAGQRDLVLLTVATRDLAITWEPSRGGELFPHLYGVLPIAAVIRVDPIETDAAGAHRPLQLT